jgi:hypothetical protein
MKDMVAIGCRLPNGFVFTPHPDENLEKQNKQLVLNGANSSSHFEHIAKDKIILHPVHYGTTLVPKVWWNVIKERYGDNFGPFVSGAIFEEKNEKFVAGKIKELVQEKKQTGFEGAKQNTAGVKTADLNSDL